MPPDDQMNRVVNYLEQARGGAENELVKLGKDPAAWKLIEIDFEGTGLSPTFGGIPDEQETALGPSLRVVTKATRPSTEYPSWLKIERLADKLVESEGITRSQARVAVYETNPELVVAYRRDRQRYGGSVKETDPWMWAKVAAVANAALSRRNDPWVLFAAGAHIEQQRMLGVLREAMPRQAR